MQTRTEMHTVAAATGMPSTSPTLPAGERGDRRPTPAWFDAPRPPFGDRGIDLGFGPVHFRIEGLAPRQAATLSARFRPFLRESGTPRLTVRLEQAGTGHFLRDPEAGVAERYRLEQQADDGGLAIWSYEFAGRLDRAGRVARLAIVEEEGARFDRGLENFLRVLTAGSILDDGGFLLHGAGVVRGGEAHIFFGPSGSGKTTVTELSPADLVLSDDLTLIVRTGEGEYEAAGIPFGMAHHRVPEATGSFPVAGFYKLVQAPQVRLETMPGSLALAEVAACLPFVMQEGAHVVHALDNLARALIQIPVHRLEFRKDPSFWGAITRGH